MTSHLHFDEYEKRAGRFIVTNGLLSNPLTSPSVLALFTNVIVLSFKSNTSNYLTEYTAISPLFELWDGNGEVPEYEMLCVDGKISARKIAKPEVPA